MAMVEPVTPQLGVLCVEPECRKVAHWRRPLTDRIYELVCDEHACLLPSKDTPKADAPTA